MTRTLPILKRWLDATLGFVYPEVCEICSRERATVTEGYVCVSCWQQVRFVKPPCCNRCGLPFAGDITTTFECSNCEGVRLYYRKARSAVISNPFMLDIIHRYKYNQALWFEPFLANLLVRSAAPAIAKEHCDVIVPVPLHPVKLRERGFNQAERLAGHLGRATGLPVNKNLLARVQPTLTQTRLNREARAKNVAGAFAPRDDRNLRGKRAVLIDDVFTTGATTNSCAKVLKSMGARDVVVWTLARGLRTT